MKFFVSKLLWWLVVFFKHRHLGASLRLRKLLQRLHSVSRFEHQDIVIGMIAFNASKTIEEAIQSVLCQSFESWSLVVVDDGSVDGTADVVLKYARLDSRIYLIQHEMNSGRAQSRNTLLGFALSELKFDVYTVLDSDDVANPDWLNMGLGALGAGADFVRCKNGRYNADLTEHHFDYMACAQIFLTKRVLMLLGGYRKEPFIEDHDFVERVERALVLLGSFGITTNGQAQRMRYHGGNMSVTADRESHRLEAAKKSEQQAAAARELDQLYFPVSEVAFRRMLP